MMEFFVSKFWAFLVSIVIMGVLVQGIQLDSQSDRNEAMNDMAEDLEAMFEDFSAAGEGLETTLRLDRLLPSTFTLTLLNGYGILQDGDRDVSFAIPPSVMRMQAEQGEAVKVDRLVIGPNDTLLLKNLDEGLVITRLSP